MELKNKKTPLQFKKKVTLPMAENIEERVDMDCDTSLKSEVFVMQLDLEPGEIPEDEESDTCDHKELQEVDTTNETISENIDIQDFLDTKRDCLASLFPSTFKKQADDASKSNPININSSNICDSPLVSREFVAQERHFCLTEKCKLREEARILCDQLDTESVKFVEQIETGIKGIKQSVKDNFQEDKKIIERNVDKLTNFHAEVQSLTDGTREMRNFPPIDKIEGLPEIKINVDKVYHLDKPDVWFKDMIYTRPKGPFINPLEETLWRTKQTPTGIFERRFDIRQMGMWKPNKSRPCEIENHNFTIDVKRTKDSKIWSRQDDMRDPLTYLSVKCSISDKCKTPINVNLNIRLMNQESDNVKDDMIKEGQFKYENPGQGHGWPIFLEWKQVTDVHERFVKFDQLCFKVSITILEN